MTEPAWHFYSPDDTSILVTGLTDETASFIIPGWHGKCALFGMVSLDLHLVGHFLMEFARSRPEWSLYCLMYD